MFSASLFVFQKSKTPPPDVARQYLAATPPPRVEAPKEEAEMPEHLIEVLEERKTEDQAQQELDEEIGRSEHWLTFGDLEIESTQYICVCFVVSFLLNIGRSEHLETFIDLW